MRLARAAVARPAAVAAEQLPSSSDPLKLGQLQLLGMQRGSVQAWALQRRSVMQPVWVTLRVTVMQPLERAQVKLRARGPVKPQRSLQLVKLTLLVTVLQWVFLLPVRALRQGRSPEWMLVSVRALASLSESVLLLPLMWVLA